MKKTLNVEGMSCMHCHGRVTKLLEGTEGVTDVNVSLENKEAVFESTAGVDMDGIVAGITELGFKAAEKE